MVRSLESRSFPLLEAGVAVPYSKMVRYLGQGTAGGAPSQS